MLHLNSGASAVIAGAGSSAVPLEFHRLLPGYAPTPLRDLPELAQELGVARLFVKDESRRFDLRAFKVLGGAWAAYRELDDRVPGGLGPFATVEELAAQLVALGPLELITATEGNHGRGVARAAAWLGLGARIFIRRGAAPWRVAALEREGATVEFVDGSYDDACEVAMRRQAPRALLIQDTSRPGYERVPTRVIEGYATLGLEVDAELAARGEEPPDLVLVQIGVGSLAAAIVRHYRAPARDRPPRIVGVEPADAACALASLAAGRPVPVAGPHRSMMSGMNCGVLAGVAWPWLERGLDAVVTVDDAGAARAMRALHRVGIEAGEAGAAGLAGLAALAEAPVAARAALGLTPRTRALVLCTEGATDPENWARVIGAPGKETRRAGHPETCQGGPTLTHDPG